MIKAIFFDMDGTILDTLSDISNSVNYALSKFGYPLQAEKDIRLMLGSGAKNLIKQAAPAHLSDEQIIQVLSTYQSFYDHNCNVNTKPYLNIIDLLKTLKKQGYLLAVVSNKYQHLVEKLNEETFESLFDLAIGEREGVPIKPAPDMLIYGFEKLKITKEEVIYIGDSEVDVKTAKNTGVASIAVTWGFRDRSVLKTACPDYIANTTDEIIAIIKRINDDKIR